jgi:hypothetical protein
LIKSHLTPNPLNPPLSGGKWNAPPLIRTLWGLKGGREGLKKPANMALAGAKIAMIFLPEDLKFNDTRPS